MIAKCNTLTTDGSRCWCTDPKEVDAEGGNEGEGAAIEDTFQPNLMVRARS